MASNGKLGYMLLGAGAAALWLSNEQNRQKFDKWVAKTKEMNIGGQNVGDMMSKAKNMDMSNLNVGDMVSKAKNMDMSNLNVSDMVSKAKNMMGKNSNSSQQSEENFPVAKGGNPDPHDTADNQMVEEGSQYSVKYYNDNIQ
ncbi:MAG TPA: hypothetical protein VEY51_20110 [Chondromyces sp.]|nr:hypothetical protein [Chondromyces sp.]